MFFDIGPLKLVALAVIAVVVFGPDKLPKLIADAMRLLRTIRQFSDSAKQDIREELGPDFEGFEFEDLNPRTFVRKQLAVQGEALGLNEVRDLRRDDITTGATALSARSAPEAAADGRPDAAGAAEA
ncbi:sec-independent translocase [Streptacidiphilus sp. P02-A3a]|uniref:sec-independent translocase n=1 Tax=Streptacidiphilus sp. P02-A3a TaxID=2704468 RepID=UPI0015F96B1E|nr:sec-independent translocase [Streptacidiphilus sp. P02-A3a]QMU69376.1 Sec-independent protein translocase TatB [Streptacidiphilus sp. P02-A3a]